MGWWVYGIQLIQFTFITKNELKQKLQIAFLCIILDNHSKKLASKIIFLIAYKEKFKVFDILSYWKVA